VARLARPGSRRVQRRPLQGSRRTGGVIQPGQRDSCCQMDEDCEPVATMLLTDVACAPLTNRLQWSVREIQGCRSLVTLWTSPLLDRERCQRCFDPQVRFLLPSISAMRIARARASGSGRQALPSQFQSARTVQALQHLKARKVRSVPPVSMSAHRDPFLPWNCSLEVDFAVYRGSGPCSLCRRTAWCLMSRRNHT
jgi:hypothetical protein